jgi:hypothetical protein
MLRFVKVSGCSTTLQNLTLQRPKPRPKSGEKSGGKSAGKPTETYADGTGGKPLEAAPLALDRDATPFSHPQVFDAERVSVAPKGGRGLTLR